MNLTEKENSTTTCTLKQIFTYEYILPRVSATLADWYTDGIYKYLA